MSLVNPSQLSATTYGNHKLYPLNGSNEKTNLPTKPSFGTTYTADDSCSSGSYEHYFLEEEEIIQLRPEDSYKGYDTEECSENQMKIKLQELERALLEDDDEGDSQTMMMDDVESEWSDQVMNPMLRGSPSSSDSNLSSISSSWKELCQLSPRTPKRLLFECANAISEGSTEEASNIITELRSVVSIQGDPSSRIAAYMVEGLAAKIASSGKYLYRALKCKEPPSSDRLAAMQILFEICPCFKFGFLAANGAMIEAFRGEKRVHIVDFDINQGNQYITLIQTLANRGGKLPYLRLTGVDDPESVQRSVGGLRVIGLRLEKLAETLKIPFEFRSVASKTELVSPSMLGCKPGGEEALVVNFAFQLHHMPDESVSTVNERDRLLRMVKSLNPKLVTVVEQDVNTNTAPFLPRFVEAYNYYSAVYESLDATLPRESQDRINVERQCLARDIVNVVACEGEERIERYEVAGKWRARMAMAGFAPRLMSATTVMDTLGQVMKEYGERFTLKEEMNGLHFGWEDKSLIVASAWK